MGYNIAALRFLKGRWEGEKVAGMMIEEGLDEERAICRNYHIVHEDYRRP